MARKEPKSLFRRLSRLFKSGPVVKRKIRGLDTTLAMADKTKSSGTLLFQKSLSPTYATITSNAYNLSERLMRYQDFQEMEYSLAIDTKIAVPDGFKTIGELAEECAKDPDKTFIVYSYDHNKKKIVPAFGRQARQTCVDHAWKITFDDGKSITASAEHRLMLRDGSYRRVEDLKPGDAMMPFLRKDLFAGAKEGTKGYSWVYTMDDRFRGWTKEHQLIAEWVAGRELAEDECVHHINFVKTDNRPENLRIMTKADHDSYHATINNGVKWAPENTEWIERFRANHAAWMRDNAPIARRDVTFARILEVAERVGFSMPAISSALDASWTLILDRLAANGFANFTQFVDAYAAGQASADIRPGKPGLLTRDLSLGLIKANINEADTKRSLCIKLGCTVSVLDKFLDRRLRMSWSELRRELGYKNDDKSVVTRRFKNVRGGDRPKKSNGRQLTFQQICDAYTRGLSLPRLSKKLGVNKNTVISCLAQNGYQKYSEFQSEYQNCKVVSIEYVGIIPLYDLTVDGYKNFATDTVISHNTPEIAAALDIYADETCAQDDRGRILHIHSDNEKIKEVLEDLFYNILNVEFNLRSWTRNLPVRKNSVIPLLDGRNITIEQLAREYEEGKQNWVYSVQDGTHRMVPGRVAWCGLTRRNSELVRVWLDDGTYVDCTPDHEWVLRDGRHKRADELVAGESLMPLYREAAMFKGKKGYERVYDPESRQYRYTHRIMVQHDWTRADVGKVVHHVNFNRSDNTPTNLRVMLPDDHIELHKKFASSYNSSPKHKLDNVQRSQAMKAMWADPTKRQLARASMAIKFDDRCVDMVVEALAAHGKYVSPRVLGNQLKTDEAFMGYFKAINEGTKRDLTKALNSHSGFKNLLRKAGFESYIELVKVRLPGIAETPWFKRAEKKSQRMTGVVPTMREHHPSAKQVHLNHKVDRVERLAETDDVYCMEVLGPNGEHDRHRFGIMCFTPDGQVSKSSIISTNCKYGDFFLYNDVSPEYGVVNAFPIPVNEIEREENYDRDDPFAVRYRWVTLGNRTLENWEVTHFRLLGNDMFLPYGSSIIEPARRIWRQLILIEDAMLVYRVVRAPERRVFYIDVANVPPENVPMYVEEQRRNLRTNQVIDNQSGRVDLRYNPLPVHKDTPVPLLDGTTMTIEALSVRMKENPDWTPWVYSVQDSTLRAVPGKVVWCGKNYSATRLVKVWLDNDTYVMTAPEHPFVMRDGSSRRADELVAGDSLMPLYRHLDTKGYEHTYSPGEDVSLPTHQIVARDAYQHEWMTICARTVRHKQPWVADNKRDNRPENLQIMTIWDHRRWHVEYLEHLRSDVLEANGRRFSSWNRSDRKKARVLQVNKERDFIVPMRWYNDSELHVKHNENRRLGQKESWVNDCEKRSVATRCVIPDVVFEELVDIIRRNPKWGRVKVHAALMSDVHLLKALSEAQTTRCDVAKFSFCAWESELKRRGYAKLPGLRQAIVGHRNHRVAKVEFLDVDPTDVYCMTVVGPNGEEDRHNFAVCGLRPTASGPIAQVDGIFLKNSVDEDYFIPVRGAETGTRIDTLAGGQNTAAVEDVAYIQKKLFAALKIPRAYLGYDELLSSKATLAQEDIRFSRTINVIQKTMLAELNKLAIIHLYAHGYDGEDLQNFTLRLSNPSTVAQQQKLELWRAKFEIGGSLPEGMGSAEFVQREIWGLTKEQIDEINKQQESEARRKAAIEAAAAAAGSGGGGEGAEDLFGGGGEEEAGGEEMPPPETAGEEPEEKTERGVQLLTSSDDQEDDENFALKLSAEDDVAPVRPKNQVQKDYEYNRSRRRTHGASKTHMPDFAKMTGNDNDAMKDPTDSEWMRSVVSNPLGEARERKSPFGGMPPDLWSTLRRMTAALKIARQTTGGVIVEGDESKTLGQLLGRDVQDEIDMGQNIDEAAPGLLGVAPDLNEVLIIDDEDDESSNGSDE